MLVLFSTLSGVSSLLIIYRDHPIATRSSFLYSSGTPLLSFLLTCDTASPPSMRCLAKPIHRDVSRLVNGNSFHSRPSRTRPAFFLPILMRSEPCSPHCLKKKGTLLAVTHW